MVDILPGEWVSFATVARKPYRCGHCGENVGSSLGYNFTHEQRGTHWAVIRICPLCNRPTYFECERQFPGVSFGGEVKNVPSEVGALYDEARKCTAASAYTAAVLSARKILMNIAVNQGADEGKTFVEYVQYLSVICALEPDRSVAGDQPRAESRASIEPCFQFGNRPGLRCS